jgi:PAS domain S-box-containing protein
VKPLVNANMKATITMALHKHRMERELENSRKLLSTILHGLPDAVLVARGSGEVLFLNHLAERTTGWVLREASGKSISEVAAIRSHDGKPMTLELLLKVGGDGTSPIRIPPHSTLTSKEGKTIDIAGQFSMIGVDRRTAGVFITLHDVTVQNREEQRIRQEQQMFVAGELAHGVALEFYSLFGLINDAMGAISKNVDQDEVDLIRKATESGSGMATQLLEFHEGNGAAHVLNVTQYVRSSHTLLQGLCGKEVKLRIASELDVGYILSTGSHFEQLIVNLVLEGKHRLAGPGEITIGIDIHSQPVSALTAGSYVRLYMRAEKSAKTKNAQDESLPLGTELPGVGLTIVRTIAIAADGFVRVTEPSESVTLIEVFLPRHGSRVAAAAAANEYSQVLLCVGFPPSLVQGMKAVFDQDAMLLGADGPEEASWISELYEGDIDLVVLSKSCLLNDEMEHARNRMRLRRPQITFIESGFTGDGSAAEPLQLMEMLREVLRSKAVAAIRSAHSA